MSYPLRLDRALWMVCAFSWDKRQIHLCLILEQRMGGHHFSDCHPRILFSPFFHFLKSPPSFTLRLSATLALSLSSILLRLSSLRGFFFSPLFLSPHMWYFTVLSASDTNKYVSHRILLPLSLPAFALALVFGLPHQRSCVKTEIFWKYGG